WHCWVALLIRALKISALIISADLPCQICQLSAVLSSGCNNGTDDQCPDDRCPAVPPTSSAHLCPAVHPPVPSSAPTCAQKCHLPVPSSATYLCPEVPPTCAQQCHPPVPT
ncbi:unnamed protein product, partial [Staurois parvus]